MRRQVSPKATLRERLDFWSEPYTPGQCRLWLGHKVRGYGQLRWRGRRIKAHRAAYTEYVGPIPEGMSVLHSCDNPGCINHEHFFLGAQVDNMADMTAKGRRAIGRQNGAAKLTEVQIPAIRADRRASRAIAAAYGVSQRTILQIKRGQNWGHVT